MIQGKFFILPFDLCSIIKKLNVKMNYKHYLICLTTLLFAVACSTTKTATTTTTSVTKSAPTVKWKAPDWAKNANIYEVNLR